MLPNLEGEMAADAADQARIKSLYAELYRTMILLGLLIAAAWLFAAFSYYLSRKTALIGLPGQVR